MNILYDGRIFKMQKAGGINRYFAEIISALPATWNPTILWADDLGRNAPSHPRLRVSDLFEFRPRRFRKALNRKWRLKPAIARADILHPTYCHISHGFPLSDITCPLVVTAYDFICAEYSHLIAGAKQVAEMQIEIMKRADHIVCISKYTEQDLIERIPSAAGKTSVIHLGTSFPIHEGPPPVIEPTSFLFVGMRLGYKNFSFLLRAFAAACQRLPNLTLKVAGAPFTESELWEMHFLGLTGKVVNVPYPDERALNALYRESAALLYPSLHEGFGIPPLEAMASQTLSVSANTTCLPEVVGDGGILLDPFSVSDWTECILQIAMSKIDRAALIQKGTTRVKQFSWARCAREHIALYDRLA